MKDNVNSPDHYTGGNVECIEAIEASLSPEGYRGYLKGNAIKYLWRYEKKGGLEDLEKANVYLGWLRTELEVEADVVNEEIKRRIENA